MFEKVIEKMMNHTDSLKNSIRVSLRLLNASIEGDIKNIEFLSNNRERLINNISALQEDIERILNSLPQEDFEQAENLEIIKAWASDTHNWAEIIGELDSDIIKALNHEKEKISSDIGAIFKTKTAFKGYNLNNVLK